MRSTTLSMLLACAAALSGCDPQVESDYPGDAIVELHGAIAVTGGVELDRMLIRWSTDDPAGPGEAVSPLAMKPVYPAQFTAALIDEPPALAELSFAGEPAFTEGYLFGLDPFGRTVGTDFDHVLVWLSGPAAAGGRTAAYLGGTSPAGFNVYERQTTDTLSPEQEVLSERCIARATGAGWSADRAQTTCRILRSYVLLPAPQGIATRWKMQAVAGSP